VMVALPVLLWLRRRLTSLNANFWVMTRLTAGLLYSLPPVIKPRPDAPQDLAGEGFIGYSTPL
jgi:hypothetical protein